MPNLAGLVREGYSGTLQSEQPPLSPLLWTTMMTGRSPLEHGILDFTRHNPETGAREPITSAERRVPAVWNMANQGGQRVAAIGLWATYPAEPVDGLMVSDRLFSFQHRQRQPPPGIVQPAAREPAVRAALAAAEAAVDEGELRRFLPSLTAEEWARFADPADPYAHPVSALRRILVETRVFDALAKQALAELAPRVTLLYLQGTDSIGHVFAPYAPPRQAWVPEADFARYHGVPERYFAAIDGLLGEYRDAVRAMGGILFLASDHGFLWADGRPRELSSMATATAGKWHRDQGIYLLWGSGIRAAEGRPGRGGIAQVCATLLALAGLPAGERIAGPALPGAPPGPAATVDYDATFQPPAPVAAAGTAAGSDEELAKLRALGYLGGAEAARRAAPPRAAGSTRTAGSFNNEGLIREARGEADAAIAAYEQAVEADPGLLSATWNLSNLLFESGRDLERADRLAIQALAAGLPSGPALLVRRAAAYQRSGRVERSVRLLAAAVAARPDEVELRIFRGRYRIEAGDCAGAEEDFAAAAGRSPENAVIQASLGLARLCRGDRSGARRAFERSLALDGDQPEVEKALAALAAGGG